MAHVVAILRNVQNWRGGTYDRKGVRLNSEHLTPPPPTCTVQAHVDDALMALMHGLPDDDVPAVPSVPLGVKQQGSRGFSAAQTSQDHHQMPSSPPRVTSCFVAQLPMPCTIPTPLFSERIWGTRVPRTHIY